MACGTAYIGLDGPYYRKLGLRPGEDFITYDGTLENLKEVIHYYQKHGDELEKIALSGTNFVRTHFNVKAVSEALFNCFESMVSDV